MEIRPEIRRENGTELRLDQGPELRGDNGMHEHSVRELVTQLAEDTSELVRKEVALARRELEGKFEKTRNDVVFMGAGGALAYAGLLGLLAAFALLLGQAMPLWVATLIVGLLTVGVGGALTMTGKKRLEKRDPTPRETISSVKNDARRIQEAFR